jgi:hypothetical protein
MSDELKQTRSLPCHLEIEKSIILFHYILLSSQYKRSLIKDQQIPNYYRYKVRDLENEDHMVLLLINSLSLVHYNYYYLLTN